MSSNCKSVGRDNFLKQSTGFKSIRIVPNLQVHTHQIQGVVFAQNGILSQSRQRTQGNQSLGTIQRHPPQVHPRFKKKQNIHGKQTPFLDGTEVGGGGGGELFSDYT